MKILFSVYICFLIFNPLLADLQTDEKIEYLTYTDPSSLFVMKYPKELLIPKNNGEFVSNDTGADRAYMEVHSEAIDENRTWEWEYDYRISTKPYDDNKEVTYKVFKKDFFAFSGFLGDRIFYEKEIAVEKNGKRYVLAFAMLFPQKDKKKWDPILTICANSFKINFQPSNGFSKGWIETTEDSAKNNLVRKAKQWVETNLQCDQSNYSNDDSLNDKFSLGKCVVDEKDIPFFNLKTSTAIQFLLSVHGPFLHRGQFFRGDYKYVLFTFENQILKGEILHQIKEGEMPGFHDPIEIIDTPEKVKLLTLEISGDGGRGSIALVFRFVNGKIKKVLDYPDWEDESKPGQGNGMESLLLPQKDGNLRIFIHRWELNLPSDDEDDKSGAKVDKYSEIFYHFDSDQEKYLPLGPEKVMSTKSASVEWDNLSE